MTVWEEQDVARRIANLRKWCGRFKDHLFAAAIKQHENYRPGNCGAFGAGGCKVRLGGVPLPSTDSQAAWHQAAEL